MTVTSATFRLVAGVLGLALLGLIAAISVLAALHDEVPTILENLATGSLTALAALLVSPHSSDDPVPVHVTDQPVAVTDKPRRTTRRRRPRGDTGLTAVGLVVLVVVVLLLAGFLGTTVHPLFWLLLVLLVLAVVL